MDVYPVDSVSKKITRLTTLTPLVTGLLVAVVCLFVLYGILKERQDEKLNASLRIDAGVVEQYVVRARETAMQMASRTVIRDRLEAYNAGRVTLGDLRAFSTPKLRDALKAARNVVAVRRFDHAGQPVFEVLSEHPEHAGLRFSKAMEDDAAPRRFPAAQMVSEPFACGDGIFFTITTPIRNGGGNDVGTDVALFDFRNVGGMVARNATGAVIRMLYLKKADVFFDLATSRFRAPGDPAIPTGVREFYRAPFRGETRNAVYLRTRMPDGETALWGGSAVVGTDWTFLCGFSEKDAYRPVYGTLLTISLGLFFIILTGTMLSIRLMRPFTGSIIVKTEQLEREIQERLREIQEVNAELHREIAERSRIEEHLRISEGRLREAEKIARLGHWELDLTSDVLYWSDEIYRIFGKPRSDGLLALGDFASVIHPDDRDGALKAYYDSVEQGLPCDIVHRIVRGDDGKTRYVHERCIHERDGEGRIVKSFGTVLDVTAEKRAEELNMEAAQSAMELRKRESLHDMAGATAHLFNNILAGIQGAVELSLAGATDGQRPLLHVVLHSVDRAAQLCRLLLQYLGKYHVSFSSIDVRGFWEDFQRSGLPAVPGNIAVEYRIDDVMLRVDGNRELLETLFRNLLQNSIEAIGDREGRIVVSCGMAPPTAAGEKPSEAGERDDKGGPGTGGYVLFSVSDTGEGIPAEHLPRLFDPFYSTRFTGRGLGLPVAEGIVRTHGGMIRIESEPGKGTVATVLLPAIQPLCFSKNQDVN
jgi:PAS domain S-box-containing protein